MSARRHWWLERLTSVALIPLTIWLIVALASRDLADREVFEAWIKTPSTLVVLGLFILTSLYHAKLGLAVIVDDYVNGPAANRFAHRLSQLILLVALVAAGAGLWHFLP